MNKPNSSLPPLPSQPVDVPFPSTDWPTGDLNTLGDATGFETACQALCDDTDAFGQTLALLAIHRGQLVYERYDDSVDATTTLHSWSMAKSILQALTGILVKQNRLDIHAPADVPEWQQADDSRRHITLDQLLTMRSGLEFTEVYESDQTSDTIEMLWGRGAGNVARYAAEKPLLHSPGEVWSYSSGTSNIIARCLAQVVGAGEVFHDFMREHLFNPLGMTSPLPKFDEIGTFKGSSFCFCTARDFARFGLLYLRDGMWDGQQILPTGWVDYARQPSYLDEVEGYGAHFWLTPDAQAFFASGFEGQRILIMPAYDLIFVRLGKTPQDSTTELPHRLYALREFFPTC